MCKKVLFVATVVKMHIMVFHLPYLEWFKKNGYEVHVCAKNDYENKEECDIPNCDKFFDLSFERSPFKLNNFKIYRELKNIVNKNNYDIIHCHTPIGGVLTRLVAKEARKRGTKVIYTAHGFHFFKGAPLLNWLIYYPIEKFLSRYTDVLITINQEDYNLAKKKMKAKRICYVPGVGIDTEKFKNVQIDKIEKRKELGIPQDATLLLSVGELSKRKNHEIIIRAISKLNSNNIHYIICGQGSLEKYLKNLISELNLDEQVLLLGFRSDIAEICKVSDIFCFSSKQEGLPVALMEAMAVGTPCVASDIRGNNDLIVHDKNGYLVDADDAGGFAEYIDKIIRDEELREKMGEHNKKYIKKFDIENVKKNLQRIYKEVLGDIL